MLEVVLSYLYIWQVFFMWFAKGVGIAVEDVKVGKGEIQD